MKIPVEKIIEKAEDALSDAVFNFEDERYQAAINRAYYAIFYCISALLEIKNINTKTHQGAHNKFNELYIKTGLLPSALNTSLDIVFALRQSGDYDLGFEPDQLEVSAAVEHARIFLTATRAYFETET